MPIIDLTPITPAVAQARALAGEIRRAYGDLSRLAAKAHGFVWSNPALTPQQAFDAFGPDATDLLRASAAFEALVAAYFAGRADAPAPAGLPAGRSVTPNPDGTVTVS